MIPWFPLLDLIKNILNEHIISKNYYKMLIV